MKAKLNPKLKDPILIIDEQEGYSRDEHGLPLETERQSQTVQKKGKRMSRELANKNPLKILVEVAHLA